MNSESDFMQSLARSRAGQIDLSWDGRDDATPHSDGVQKRVLGKRGLEVSAIGFGCTGVNFSYSHALSNAESIKLVRQAVERSVTFFDTVEVYGPFTNGGDRQRGSGAVPQPDGDRHRVRVQHRER